jgi:tetrahydromethanopterin S-methyltransferase subunit G
MGLFDTFKKKKYPVPVPPPAPMPEFPELPREDQAMPVFPEIPEEGEDYALPDLPESELPEVPEFEPQEIPDLPEVDPEMSDLPRELPPAIEEPPEPIAEGPTFVSSNDYRKIMSQINEMKERLVNAEHTFRLIGEIKMREEKEFSKWRNQLESLEKQLSFAESLLAKSEV